MALSAFLQLLNILQSVNSTSISAKSVLKTTTVTSSTPPLFSFLRLKDNVSLSLSSDDCRGVYGCFPLGAPWESTERPISLPPSLLQDFSPFFCFYSAANPNCQKIEVEATDSIEELDITNSTYLIIITHGFLDSVEMPWLESMVKALLSTYDDDLKVMSLDWRKGSRPPYAQAVANTRLLGAVTGHALRILVEENGLKPSNIHLIGHSLGAQTMGYAGRFLKMQPNVITVGRITGMDPAGPYFRRTPSEVHLDASDAFLVDILHTDSTDIIPTVPVSLGFPDSSGHFDFYPNGGGEQNGCQKSSQDILNGRDVTSIIEFVSCSHSRAYHYFTSSIARKCSYIGIECSSWNDYKAGKCWDCSQNRCFQMGFDVKQMIPDDDLESLSKLRPEPVIDIVSSKETKISIYLATTDDKYTCGDQLRFTVRTSSSKEAIESGGEFGNLKLFLRGEKEMVEVSPFNDVRHIKPAENITWVEAVAEIGEIQSLVFHFHEDESFLKKLFRPISAPSVFIQEVIIEKLAQRDRLIFKFCKEEVMAGELIILKPNADCSTASEETSSYFDEND